METVVQGHSRTLAQTRFLDQNEGQLRGGGRWIKPRRLVVAAAVVASAAVGFGIGKGVTAPSAEASSAHRYTLRVGDAVTIPAVSQRCAVYREGGSPELYCARPLRPRHQVTIFRDSILIWKAGNPDRPAWSGKP